MTTYCWQCYARNDRASGACRRCGGEIADPPGASVTERLLWGAAHPDPDVAMIAVRRLAALGDAGAVPSLRRLVLDPPDPYVGAEALRSLLTLSSAGTERDLLVQLARHGPVLTRRIAVEALDVQNPAT